MQSINEKIDVTLSALGLPYYYGMPEFGSGQRPEAYLTYDFYDNGAQYAEDDLQSTANYITVHIISPTVDNALKNKLKQIFSDAGFLYTGGGNLPQDDKIYPYTLHHYMEFTILIEEE